MFIQFVYFLYPEEAAGYLQNQDEEETLTHSFQPGKRNLPLPGRFNSSG